MTKTIDIATDAKHTEVILENLVQDAQREFLELNVRTGEEAIHDESKYSKRVLGTANPKFLATGDGYKFVNARGEWESITCSAFISSGVNLEREGAKQFDVRAGYAIPYVYQSRNTRTLFNMVPAIIETHKDLARLNVANNLNLFRVKNGTLVYANKKIQFVQDTNGVAPLWVGALQGVSSNVKFDRNASYSEFDSFVTEILYDVTTLPDASTEEVLEMVEKSKRVLKLYIALSMFGLVTQAQRVLILNGNGNNGKSLFLDVVKRLFEASQIGMISPAVLQSQGFGLGQIRGVKLNIVDDLAVNAFQQMDVWKSIVSGADQSADVKYKADHARFKAEAGHIYNSNVLPQINDPSGGAWRRFVVIPMTRNFAAEGKADHTLINRLASTESLSGILNWVLEGLVDYIDNGLVAFDDTAKNSNLVLRDWRIGRNSIASFVDAITIAPTDTSLRLLSSPGEVYELYKQFCDTCGMKPFSRARLIEQLKVNAMVKTSGKNTYILIKKEDLTLEQREEGIETQEEAEATEEVISLTKSELDALIQKAVQEALQAAVTPSVDKYEDKVEEVIESVSEEVVATEEAVIVEEDDSEEQEHIEQFSIKVRTPVKEFEELSYDPADYYSRRHSDDYYEVRPITDNSAWDF